MSQQPRQVSTHLPSPAKSFSRRTASGGISSSTNTASSPQPISQPSQQQQQQHPVAITAPRSLLPSPHFEDDPIVASHQQHSYTSKRPSLTLNDPSYSEHAVAESELCGGQSVGHGAQIVASPLPQDDEIQHSFQPFFTLIEDTVTNEHHHPTVHYIFADDDVDIITEAALRSLEILDPTQRASRKEQGNAQQQHSRSGEMREGGGGGGSDDPNDNSLNASRLPPIVAGTREHYIVLDVHPTSHSQPQGYPSRAQSSTAPEDPSFTTTTTATPLPQLTTAHEVMSAHSLSAEWAVLRTSISAAPTITDSEDHSDSLMLRIEGRGNTPGDIAGAGRDKGKEKDKDGGGDAERERERDTLEEMIDRFTRRLEDIRSVLDAGGGMVLEGGDAEVEGMGVGAGGQD